MRDPCLANNRKENDQCAIFFSFNYFYDEFKFSKKSSLPFSVDLSFLVPLRFVQWTGSLPLFTKTASFMQLAPDSNSLKKSSYLHKHLNKSSFLSMIMCALLIITLFTSWISQNLSSSEMKLHQNVKFLFYTISFVMNSEREHAYNKPKS